MAYAPAIDLGTPKGFVSVISPLLNFDPLASGWTTLSLSSYVPAGCLAVFAKLQFVSSAVNDYIIVAQSSARTTRMEVVQYSQAANIPIQSSGIIRLAADLSIAYYSSDARISGVYLELATYFL